MCPQDHIDKWIAGQGLWGNVSEADWKNRVWQLHNRIQSIGQLKELIQLTHEEEGCSFAKQKLLVGITPHYFNLIDRRDPDRPIRKQVIP